MIKHRLRGLSMSFGSQVDPEKTEELKRTKTDIESNLTRILKLIKNEDQCKRDGNPTKDSRKETELVGLIEDFFTQYQSLYALYDRLAGENGKLVPRRRERGASSLSSSSSDSEYFSSDEVDGIYRRQLSENEHPNVSDTTKGEPEISNTEVNNPTKKEKELQEQLTRLKKEVESLSQHKRDLELQMESKATEVKQLTAKNTGMHARNLELESLVKKKEGEVSDLLAKLKNNENQAMSNMKELKAQINNLKLEAKSLRTQKIEMEGITRSRNEALTQMDSLRDQLDDKHQNLDSLRIQNKELEAQLEKERETISQYLIQIETLNEQLDEKRMVEEKDGFLARVKDLELELESRRNQQNELQEQLRHKIDEIEQLGDENIVLRDRNLELNRVMTQRGEEFSAFVKAHESDNNGASILAMTLTAKGNDQRPEINYWQEEKSKLELRNGQNQKEYSESLAKMENLNVNLTSKIDDQEKIIKEQAETIQRISMKYEEEKIWSKKFKLNRQFTERRMEELAEEVRKKLEDNIRLLYQRIHVAEQLHNENKDSYKLVKERYEKENKTLVKKIASCENELRGLSVMKLTPADVLNGLDLAAGKLEEHKEYLLSRVSKMFDEVQFAKDWIKKRNGEIKQLKDSVDCLNASLDDKEEQEFLLREKVWKLEAKVSKEGGEKLNLMKSVSQLEKKVGRLEKSLKEKDEELVNLGEMKREAIRQLCFLNDYHRNRCDYLKYLISRIRVTNRTGA